MCSRSGIHCDFNTKEDFTQMNMAKQDAVISVIKKVGVDSKMFDADYLCEDF